jgi:hypothetical protein
MPELSRFYGIVIAIYYRDHSPPHIHAYVGGKGKDADHEIQVRIPDGAVLEGSPAFGSTITSARIPRLIAFAA